MTLRTNIGATLGIATVTTPSPDPDNPLAQNDDLLVGGFADLTYTTIPNVGNIGDTGVDQNMVSYPTWGETLTKQLKGAATGAQAEIRVLDVASDGLTALKLAGAVTNLNNYAFKITWPDGSVEYNRGVVGAPSYSKGSNEDFAEAIFTVALNQEPVFA